MVKTHMETFHVALCLVTVFLSLLENINSWYNVLKRLGLLERLPCVEINIHNLFTFKMLQYVDKILFVLKIFT